MVLVVHYSTLLASRLRWLHSGLYFILVFFILLVGNKLGWLGGRHEVGRCKHEIGYAIY